MTLMDAPKYDAVASRRRSQTLYGFLIGFVVLLLAAWFAVGHPLDGPWTWWTYWTGEHATEKFLGAVEANDLPRAYGIWVDDPAWQQHSVVDGSYTFARFSEDWGQNSSANDYGTIKSHRVVVEKMWGNVLVVGSLINGRKSKALFLSYDRKAHTLGFSPVELTFDQ
jgi:hypothetical protein